MRWHARVNDTINASCVEWARFGRCREIRGADSIANTGLLSHQDDGLPVGIGISETSKHPMGVAVSALSCQRILAQPIISSGQQRLDDIVLGSGQAFLSLAPHNRFIATHPEDD
jgi:hypothetical protein